MVRASLQEKGYTIKLTIAVGSRCRIGCEHNWHYVLTQRKWAGRYRKLPVFDATTAHLVARKTNEKAEAALKAFGEGVRRRRGTGALKQIGDSWF